jgi:endogenous inhibitor of DNA gyrase (YacG/DUF329 family)
MRPEDSLKRRDMVDIKNCCICGKPLEYPRNHVDTCGKRCFKVLLSWQRALRYVIE